jgi:hypothetical protein
VKIPGTRARAALREARQTYRRHSGAEPAVAVIEATAERQDRQLPSIAERGRDAVRRLRERRRFPARRDDPDVVLDIPRVHVDEIELKLDELHARVALEAHVLDLLRLDVGVEADVRGVDLKIAGVEAEARLKVRLENLTMILDRVDGHHRREPADHLRARGPPRRGRGTGRRRDRARRTPRRLGRLEQLDRVAGRDLAEYLSPVAHPLRPPMTELGEPGWGGGPWSRHTVDVPAPAFTAGAVVVDRALRVGSGVRP